MAGQRARYGVDAPGALFGLSIGAFFMVLWAIGGFTGHWGWVSWILLLAAIYSVLSAATFAYTTLRGKFDVWADELDGLALSGTERVTDLGCGRGAVLVQAAQRLRPGAKVIGVDLWRTKDQSGNAEAATIANAQAEGVADRIELVTGDLRELPLPDASVDLVLSSLAIHNIPDAAGREAAIAHAFRVLAPGGRLRIADFRHTGDYAAVLERLGAEGVAVRSLGWRFWYGGPQFGTSMVTALKP